MRPLHLHNLGLQTNSDGTRYQQALPLAHGLLYHPDKRLLFSVYVYILYNYQSVSLFISAIVTLHFYQDTQSTARMPTVLVLILIVDEPHYPNMVGPTLDANVVEGYSTADRPTVEILNVYALNRFHRAEHEEIFEGRQRWRWCDSASCKTQPNTFELEAEDGLVFDLTSYYVQRLSTRILGWIDSTDVGRAKAKDRLRQMVNETISSFEKDFDASNNSPANNDQTRGRFRLELLGDRGFDQTTNSRFVMVRKLRLLDATGTTSITRWTQRYWWEIKEIHVDTSVGSS